MIERNKALPFIFLLFFISNVFTESIWVKYSNQVYEGAGDARAIALSEAEVASATGPLAILWNPSRLSAREDRVFLYAHQERFAGSINFDVIGIDLKSNTDYKWSYVLIREAIQGIPNTTKALLYDTGSLDDLNQRIIADKVTYFNQVQWASIIGVSTSWNKWYIGGNTKLLLHQLGSYTGYGVAFDLGVYRQFGANNTFALAIRDFTTSWVIWESGTIERIAPEISIGDAYSLTLIPDRISAKLMMDITLSGAGRKNSDDFHIRNMGGDIRVGMDVQYNRNLHLRFGRNPLTNHSVGIGMDFAFGMLDYAFTPSPIGSALGSSHYISIKVKLDYLKYLQGKLDS